MEQKVIIMLKRVKHFQPVKTVEISSTVVDLMVKYNP